MTSTNTSARQTHTRDKHTQICDGTGGSYLWSPGWADTYPASFRQSTDADCLDLLRVVYIGSIKKCTAKLSCPFAKTYSNMKLRKVLGQQPLRVCKPEMTEDKLRCQLCLRPSALSTFCEGERPLADPVPSFWEASVEESGHWRIQPGVLGRPNVKIIHLYMHCHRHIVKNNVFWRGHVLVPLPPWTRQ